MQRILGIETSCDDTAVAVITSTGKILSNILSSQDDFHAKYGGIVPEVASRKHLELISVVVQEALTSAETTLSEIDLIAVTHGPGLVGSLLIGVDYAKTLSSLLGKPIIGVNHLEGHLLSPTLLHPEICFPFLGVIVSGGHTQCILVEGIGQYTILAETLDDACGEALDKFGKMLSIPYPAGPKIEKIALAGDPNVFSFPLPKIREKRFALSFSGIKTAASLIIQGMTPEERENRKADLCASFQEAVMKQIIHRIQQLIPLYSFSGIAFSGGVSANQRLRDLALQHVQKPVYFPSRILSTDNAAMIAHAGYQRYLINGPMALDFPVISRLELSQ